MASARSGHTATTLSDGRIFIAGGDAAGSAEIYDPAANTFSSVTAAMTAARRDHSAVRMADGRVLIVGGTSLDAGNIRTGEIFDAATSTFSQVGNSTADEHIHALLRLLPDGKVQIIGGTDHGDIEIYDPSINQFGAHSHVFPNGDSHPELVQQILDSPTRAALFYHGASGALLDREGHTITEITGSNQALVAGGTDSSNNVLNSVSVLSSSPATITTDKLDYAPGTPVVVSGTGFAPNETVTLTFHEDPHPPTENPHTFTVTTDANGNFTDQQYAPEDGDVGVAYILAAVGGTSGLTAQTAFTDNKTITINFGGTGSGTVTSTSTPTIGGQQQFNCASTGGVKSGTCNNVAFDNSAQISLTATASSGSNLGAWSLPAGVLIVSGCSNGNSSCVVNLNNNAGTITLTINSNTNTNTTVASSANPSVFGQSVTFTAMVTPSTATGSVDFKDGLATIGSGTLSGGQATFATSSLSVGSHSITAVYPGATGFNGSNSTVLTQIVNQASTSTTITSNHLNPLAWSSTLSTASGPSMAQCDADGLSDTHGRLIVFARAGCGSGADEVWVLNGANGVGTTSWSTCFIKSSDDEARTVHGLRCS
jgi:hypothetical protein